MRTLRDQIAADVATVLSDDAAFGGTVDVDGKLVSGVLDEDTRRAGAGGGVEGVNVAESVLFVSPAEIRRPVPAQRLKVNGRPYYVKHVGESMGLLAVRLELNES